MKLKGFPGHRPADLWTLAVRVEDDHRYDTECFEDEAVAAPDLTNAMVHAARVRAADQAADVQRGRGRLAADL